MYEYMRFDLYNRIWLFWKGLHNYMCALHNYISFGLVPFDVLLFIHWLTQHLRVQIYS